MLVWFAIQLPRSLAFPLSMHVHYNTGAINLKTCMEKQAEQGWNRVYYFLISLYGASDVGIVC